MRRMMKQKGTEEIWWIFALEEGTKTNKNIQKNVSVKWQTQFKKYKVNSYLTKLLVWINNK